ncbi:DUF2785 domain-containing protein [Litorilituus lipolyticus]|nr:DUF2785 domain-containing protein [Litorilituus lipolyticus]
MQLLFNIFVVSICTLLSVSSYAYSAAEQEPINAQQTSQQCFSKTWGRAELNELKAKQFTLTDTETRQELAIQLLHCLAHPEPTIRDGIAFEALSHWLRSNELSPEIQIKMFNSLIKVLSTPINDANDVYQSFAMLVVSELARSDRKKTYLSVNERNELVNVGTSYLKSVRDYRGFSNDVGWRHGVAHSADLMLQLALNPNISSVQLDLMLGALSSQIQANNLHAYIHGEPKRLAVAVIYIFLNSDYKGTDWSVWLNSIAEPKPFNDWSEVYQSEKGLIKLHNTQNFLNALYALVKPSKHEKLVTMVTPIEKALKQVQ